MPAKYIVGIDLGTTNSAVACCDASAAEGAAEEHSRVEVRGIPQLVNPNEVAERTLLPSFLYIPGEFDFPKGSLALPWESDPKFVIGELARKRGAESPNRLVASAKSWLSYAGVDRTAPILPWQAPAEGPKLSPVEASSQFLQHLRSVWDAGEAGGQPELALVISHLEALDLWLRSAVRLNRNGDPTQPAIDLYNRRAALMREASLRYITQFGLTIDDPIVQQLAVQLVETLRDAVPEKPNSTGLLAERVA